MIFFSILNSCEGFFAPKNALAYSWLAIIAEKSLEKALILKCFVPTGYDASHLTLDSPIIKVMFHQPRIVSDYSAT